MRLEDLSFDETSKAVNAINEVMREKYGNARNIRDHMVSMAYKYMHEARFFQTGGFVLTAYGEDSDRVVVASVMAYSVNVYLRGGS